VRVTVIRQEDSPSVPIAKIPAGSNRSPSSRKPLVSDALVAEGYKAPRGGLLGAESVFSIYKKGVGRLNRLNASPRLEIRAVKVLAF
jgi:hypothetical protein